MYFPSASGTVNQQHKYLLERLEQWENEFDCHYSTIIWKAVLISTEFDEENNRIWDIFSCVFIPKLENYEKEEEFTWYYPFSNDQNFYSKFNFNFTDVQLIKRYMDFEEIKDFISQITAKTVQSGQTKASKISNGIQFKDLKLRLFNIKRMDWRFQGYLRTSEDWSYYSVTLHQDSENRNVPFPLLSEKNPVYEGYRFEESFFGSFSREIRNGQIQIVLPIYLAKVTSVIIIGKKLLLKVINKTNKNLTLKLNALQNNEIYENLEDFIIPADKDEIEFELSKEYIQISGALYIEDSTHYIQEIRTGQKLVETKYIVFPETIEELYEFTKEGEDQFREFKEEIDKSNILKEMIAFGNRNEGLVCVGVCDDGITYVGVDKQPNTFRDELIDYVSNNCDPPDLPFNIKSLEFEENRYIHLILVGEGTDKPYYHRPRKTIYYRAKGTSRPILRKELMDIVSNNRSTGY